MLNQLKQNQKNKRQTFIRSIRVQPYPQIPLQFFYAKQPKIIPFQFQNPKRPQTTQKKNINKNKVTNFKLRKTGFNFHKNKNYKSLQSVDIKKNLKKKQLIKVTNMLLNTQTQINKQCVVKKSNNQYLQTLDEGMQLYKQVSKAFPMKQKFKPRAVSNNSNSQKAQPGLSPTLKNYSSLKNQNPQINKVQNYVQKFYQSTKLSSIERYNRVDQLIKVSTIKQQPAGMRKKKMAMASSLQLKPQVTIRYKKKPILSSVSAPSNLDIDKVYIKKIQSFMDFIFKVNISNNIVTNTFLTQENSSNFIPVKVFIGGGNNCNLIKALIKRRFWLQISSTISQQTVFIWTQNTKKQIHCNQQKYLQKNPDDRFQQQQNIIKKLKNYSDSNLKITKNYNSKLILDQNLQIAIQNYISTNYLFSKDNQQIGGNLPSQNIITNHIPHNSCIGSKKGLYYTMKSYYQSKEIDPFSVIPMTYHFSSKNFQQYKDFLQKLKGQTQQLNKIWIVKPGQCSNRGSGIKLMKSQNLSMKQIKHAKHANGQEKTIIIQQYIKKPFLYYGRKFDIRHFMMITSVNGILKAYWYDQGYIRTTSQQYSLSDLQDLSIHLTNDAIQKKFQNYGKHQPANKISYNDFQRYLDKNYISKKYNFEEQVLKRMKQIGCDIVRANYQNLSKSRNLNNFELFGLDFMLDNKMNVYLIEVNSNPCLEVNCGVLGKVIPSLIQNTLRIGLDPLILPKCHYPLNKRYFLSDNWLQRLRYSLIFDEIEYRKIVKQIGIKNNLIDMQFEYVEDYFENQGKQIQLDNACL